MTKINTGLRSFDSKINRRQWAKIFQEIYGDPACQICGRKLIWYDAGRRGSINTVHWDHRSNKNGIEKPSQWLACHVVNKWNINTWIIANLGMLCKQCNFYIGRPSKNRMDKAKKLFEYVINGKTLLVL